MGKIKEALWDWLEDYGRDLGYDWHNYPDVKNWDNDASKRKKQELRDLRIPLLEEADHKINTLVDNGGDASAWRTYRQRWQHHH